MAKILLITYIAFNWFLKTISLSEHLDSERNLLQILTDYIDERELYLDKAIRYLTSLEDVRDRLKGILRNNVGPCDSLRDDWIKYLKAKRIVVEWKLFQQFLRSGTSINDKIKESILSKQYGVYSDWILEQNHMKLLDYVKKLLKITNIQKYSNNKVRIGNQKNCNKRLRLKKQIINKLGKLKGSIQEFMRVTQYDPERQFLFWDDYKQLCQGKSVTTENSNMKCRYFDNNKPYFLIGPLKREEIHSDPQVFIFHKILFDSEIEEIQRLVEQQSMFISQGKETEYRVAKVTWLHKSALWQLQRRIELATNLDMLSAENFQVAVYGLGGHYAPHYDADLNEHGITHNRIATVLFYMNDVEEGGATVFPKLKLSVWPDKGNAVFWYNIASNYKPDTRTLHAGCPLFTGNKWVLNSWIRREGQEFRKPCMAEGNSFVY